MKTLRKNINKFYKHYDIANIGFSISLTKGDMYDHDTLMNVYSDLWEAIDYYEHEDKTICQWLTALYGELGDYLDCVPTRPNYNKILAILKLCVAIFGTMSIGAFIAVWIECGYDIMIIVGIVMGMFLAVCSGIGAYEDIKVA